MSCISRPKQPLGWGSPCHRLHMNSLRYSCYLLTIDQVSTDHRPSVDQLLTDTSVKYRWRKSYIGRDISGTTIDRVSTECRPTIVLVSTDYRPTIDRYIDWVSTDYRPTIYRYIDRVSTDFRLSVDRLSIAISTDRSVDTTKNFTLPFPLILDTTEWKYAQLICHIYNNWLILVKTEWKYVLMIDHIKTGRF